MLRQAKAAVRVFMWSCRRNDRDNRVGTGMAVVAACVVSYGCTHMQPVTQDPAAQQPAAHQPAEQGPAPVEEYVAYAKRAAQVDGQTWNSMKARAEQEAGQTPMEARIRLGILLTSPGQPPGNLEEGKRILADVLATEAGLDRGVVNLIEIRLADAKVRGSLYMKIDDLQGKIDELLSIESSMEEERRRSEGRPLQ